MRKKIGVFLLLIMCLTFFSGCHGKGGSCEVALITDGGTVEDGKYNEVCYKGMKQYCTENSISSKVYIPDYESTDSYLAQIKKANDEGAKVIICPSYMMEEAVYLAAPDYPKTKFVLVDGTPHNSDYSDTTIAENVLAITFSEEEAGFLAGYAAVRDGYRRMGFIGGMAEDSVIKYGYGFIQGADYAGIELGEKIYIAYTYPGTFSENKDVHDFVSILYDYGVESIFVVAGASGKSVMKAAEEKSGDVIGADFDQSRESSSIVFSCIKNMDTAVYNALSDVYNDSFAGGTEKHLTAAENGVALTLDNSKFKSFSDVEYKAIYNGLATKEIVPYGDTSIGNTSELNLVNTEIIYQ